MTLLPCLPFSILCFLALTSKKWTSPSTTKRLGLCYFRHHCYPTLNFLLPGFLTLSLVILLPLQPLLLHVLCAFFPPPPPNLEQSILSLPHSTPRGDLICAQSFNHPLHKLMILKSISISLVLSPEYQITHPTASTTSSLGEPLKHCKSSMWI